MVSCHLREYCIGFTQNVLSWFSLQGTIVVHSLTGGTGSDLKCYQYRQLSSLSRPLSDYNDILKLL